MRGAQLSLGLAEVRPSDAQLREAHRELRVRLPFEQAMSDTCFRICIKNYATARLRRRAGRARR